MEVLGLGTAAGKESPAMLCMLWALLTLPEGHFEVVSEAAAANLVQLLYTGTGTILYTQCLHIGCTHVYMRSTYT